MSDTHLLALLTVVLVAVVVLVLAVALILVRKGLTRISRGSRPSPPRCRASSRSTCVRSRARSRRSTRQFDIILGALPGIARKAAIVAERRPR